MNKRLACLRLPLAGPADPWLYRVARLVLVPAALAYGRYEVEGAGLLPEVGPALVVANHPCDIDPILVALPFRRTLRFMTDAVQFDRAFVGWCVRRLGTFPVRREAFAGDALRIALELLRRGEVVAVFPEGDVYADGMHEFAGGVAFLAEKSGAPVTPIAITGAEELVRGGWWKELPAGWGRRPRVRLIVGEPVDVVASSPRDYESRAEMLRSLIASLGAGAGGPVPAP